MLNAHRRTHELQELADRGSVDVLVIGGGITGCGVALDAASRGLRVALVEAHDLAHGTSRWSSKLVHGGLRYLGQGQVGVAWESARERHLLMTAIAPHLVRSLQQVIPIYPHTSSAYLAKLQAGIRAGDLMRRATGNRVLPAPGRLDPDTARRLVPGIRTTGLLGALSLWDGQLEDDARLVVAVARTAAAHGASILTRVRAMTIDDRRATLRDELTGSEFGVRARHVINATGVWAGTLDPSIKLSPSRGTHLVVDSALLGHPEGALTVRLQGAESRFIFALPQSNGLSYIGITDVPTESVDDAPQSTPEEVQEILDGINQGLELHLNPSDVLATYAGLRPLVSGDGESADLSRRHAVLDNGDGLITLTGGKLTTYRAMAQDAVDRISKRPCQTQAIPLVGAGTSSAQNPWLRRRYGTEAALVSRLAATAPGGSQRLCDEDPTCGTEVLWAIRAEGALDVDDVLERRTRLGLVAARAEQARPMAVELIASSFASTANR